MPNAVMIVQSGAGFNYVNRHGAPVAQIQEGEQPKPGKSRPADQGYG